MGLIVYPSEATLWFIDRMDTYLLYICVLIQTPLALMILLLTLVLSSGCTTCRRRFVIFDFKAPLWYAYHLLVFSIVMAVYCLYQVWETLFIASRGPCEEEWRLSVNDTDCVMMEIKINPAINAVITMLGTILLIYALTLRGLLGLTGGKITCREDVGTRRSKGLRLVRIILAIGIQVTVVLAKLVFVFWFISVQLGWISTRNRLDHNGWFTYSVLLDVLLFVVLTPWFMFQRNEMEEGAWFSIPLKTMEDNSEGSDEEEILVTREKQSD